ncbi:MAG TPA: hypothetical protein VN711_01910 [Candidatus Saccharimonadales bacterium]|nr:hypothetical protein [Candidatus Saccharimonadales bacterium]
MAGTRRRPTVYIGSVDKRLTRELAENRQDLFQRPAGTSEEEWRRISRERNATLQVMKDEHNREVAQRAGRGKKKEA